MHGAARSAQNGHSNMRGPCLWNKRSEYRKKMVGRLKQSLHSVGATKLPFAHVGDAQGPTTMLLPVCTSTTNRAKCGKRQRGPLHGTWMSSRWPSLFATSGRQRVYSNWAELRLQPGGHPRLRSMVRPGDKSSSWLHLVCQPFLVMLRLLLGGHSHLPSEAQPGAKPPSSPLRVLLLLLSRLLRVVAPPPIPKLRPRPLLELLKVYCKLVKKLVQLPHMRLVYFP